MLKIFVDRGGTFTDLVALTDQSNIVAQLYHHPERFLIVPLEDKKWVILYKLLSENPEVYRDAVIQGIRDILSLKPGDILPSDQIDVIKMGTTVATNALLERKGDRTVLLITKGFKDVLRIGQQNRPNIFAREIILLSMLYELVIEVEERYDVNGNVLTPLNIEQVKQDLERVYETGIRSCAIVLMHSYRYPEHENQVAKIAQEIGFTQVSISHQVSPLMKLVFRGDTTVVDAYLSPILKRYVNQIYRQVPDTRLMFMKSDGGLIDAEKFEGKDSILSGPAGGIVGAVQTSLRGGFKKIIGFDMGGTSTDVSHYNGEYERQIDNEIAGVRIRIPMLSIHTVAAGGGSILFYDGNSFRVGPESAGANPGPACYRRGGPLAVTDANVMLGKIQPRYFPHIFGSEGNLPLDNEIVIEKFTQLSQEIYHTSGYENTPAEVAEGFLKIAVENMSNAIKKVSLQRGYDITDYTLTSFGGAGGQVCCLIAENLGIKRIFIHPYSGVLSAYGMGLADIRIIKENGIEKILTQDLLTELVPIFSSLEKQGKMDLNSSVEIQQQEVIKKVNLKYQGTDSTLPIYFSQDLGEICSNFAQEHQERYGFIQSQKSLIVGSISLEIVQKMDTPEEPKMIRIRPLNEEPKPVEIVSMFTHQSWHNAPIYLREDLQVGDRIKGTAIIIEKISTIIVEPQWEATLTENNHLILSYQEKN